MTNKIHENGTAPQIKITLQHVADFVNGDVPCWLSRTVSMKYCSHFSNELLMRLTVLLFCNCGLRDSI